MTADDWETVEPLPLPLQRPQVPYIPEDIRRHILALAEAMQKRETVLPAGPAPKYSTGDHVVSRCEGYPAGVGRVTEVHPRGTPAQGKVFWVRGRPEPTCCVYRVSYYDKHGPHRFHPEHELELIRAHFIRLR